MKTIPMITRKKQIITTSNHVVSSVHVVDTDAPAALHNGNLSLHCCTVQLSQSFTVKLPVVAFKHIPERCKQQLHTHAPV